jgi:tRNA(Ile)-lysidine synthase
MARLDLALEHRWLKELKQKGRLPKRVLIAFSGGIDSVVLGELLCKWRRYLKMEIAVAHIDHGHSPSEKQRRYRAQAKRFARAWSRRHELEFFTAKASGSLESEADFRKFRHESLRQLALEYGADVVAFAHHADDLLETRVLRLIRGSGAQGLRAMATRRGWIWRPLLSCTRAEIEAYAKMRSLKWIDDPSNAETNALRNWLRHDWLPQLEAHKPGALKALSRSLEFLASAELPLSVGPYVGLRRQDVRRMSAMRRQRVVARYLTILGLHDFSHTHVREILKRIDTRQKDLKFALLGHEFRLTPDLLWASRV